MKRFKTWLAALSIVLAVLIGNTTAIADSVKWHPGHYVMLVGSGNTGKNSDYYMSQIYRELDANKAIRGIAARYDWDEIETSKGVYDFRSIDKLLAGLSQRDKQLIILLEYKSFTPEILVPKYLQTAEYEGGVFALGSNGNIKGYNVKLWNTEVHKRLVALIDAVGQHVNSHPNFEGFGLQETAMGQALKPLTSVQSNGFYTNLISTNKSARVSFPNTMTFQLANFPRPVLTTLIPQLQTIGATLGATDIFIEEPGLLAPGTKYTSKGLYLYFPELTGKMPLLAQVEKSNYQDSKHDGTGFKPTVNQLLTFGKEKLHANYILWTRSPDYFGQVLQMLNQKAQTETPSGGLNATCPTSITCLN